MIGSLQSLVMEGADGALQHMYYHDAIGSEGKHASADTPSPNAMRFACRRQPCRAMITFARESLRARPTATISIFARCSRASLGPRFFEQETASR
jgi:hypothetical protein